MTELISGRWAIVHGLAYFEITPAKGFSSKCMMAFLLCLISMLLKEFESSSMVRIKVSSSVKWVLYFKVTGNFLSPWKHCECVSEYSKKTPHFVMNSSADSNVTFCLDIFLGFFIFFSFNRYLKLGIPRCLQVLLWILWPMVKPLIFYGIACWSHGCLLGTYVQLSVQHREIYIQ